LPGVEAENKLEAGASDLVADVVEVGPKLLNRLGVDVEALAGPLGVVTAVVAGAAAGDALLPSLFDAVPKRFKPGVGVLAVAP